ncbi:MAG: hypothetical protein OEY00_08495, partial [Gammaproteobacteria bacterium]|nr:hypothetical protein [Gammaproteobacteria bacterium]
GGDGDDDFDISSSVTGSLLGGAGSDDFDFLEVGQTVATLNGEGGDDYIYAALETNTWVATSTNTGTLNSDTGFEGIENLIGNDGVDMFYLGADVTGLINGLDGNDQFFISNNVSGTMNGGNDNDEFTITSLVPVTGIMNGNADNDTFTISGDFSTINGGSGNDTFNVTSGVSGTVNGNENDDELNVNIAGLSGVNTLIFDGGIGNNNVNFTGGDSSYDGSFTADVIVGPFFYDQISYNQGGNTFNVQYRQVVDALDDVIATDFSINGSAANDLIELNSGTAANLGSRVLPLDRNGFIFGGGTQVYFSGKTNMAVNGNGGTNDTIELTQDIDLGAGNLILNAEIIDVTNDVVDYQIAANHLELNGVQSIINLANDGQLQTSVNTLGVANSGDVRINETDNISITSLSNTGLVEINAGGAITGSDLSHAAALNLTAANDINLVGVNQLSGPMQLFGQNIRLINDVNTNLVNGSADLLEITMNNANFTGAGDYNDFVVHRGNNVSLTDSDDLIVTTAAVTGTLSVTANGLGVGTVEGNTVSLNAGSGALYDLHENNNINIIANRTQLSASTGIGTDSDPIETQTAELDVINSGNNGSIVNIINTGAVLVTNLVNNGDIYFTNDDDVTINNINTNYDIGTLNMRVNSGSVFGAPKADYNVSPDITAYSVEILVPQGDFGTIERPISVEVQDTFSLLSNNSVVFYAGTIPPRSILDSSAFATHIFAGLGLLSGGDLIEIESLAELDPAIFTNVSNYTYPDLAVMLPEDQSYAVKDDDKKKKKKAAEEGEEEAADDEAAPSNVEL